MHPDRILTATRRTILTLAVGLNKTRADGMRLEFFFVCLDVCLEFVEIVFMLIYVLVYQ